jgi:hypothetical protein
MTEDERKAAFKACPILADYLATMLQDVQLSEADEACEEEREERDAGTIYTVPDSIFDQARELCESFYADNRQAIEEALELVPGEDGLRFAGGRYVTLERIGSTLYLASVGHGVTFTDDGNAPCLERLADAARALRRESPYFGDDGRLYAI